jgi:hypothetical protein
MYLREDGICIILNLIKFSNAGLIERTDSIVNPDELENAFSKNRDFLTVYLDALRKH